MSKQHNYTLTTRWTGNTGQGTMDYRMYERSHTVSINHKADILCSSDPAFRGDATRHNPEEFLVAALSSCHMLWYLHLCADAGVVVSAYVDQAVGTMVETEGGGHFKEVILHPEVTVTDPAMVDRAKQLHDEAHRRCFIANSCNFPVLHRPNCKVVLQDGTAR